MAKKTNDTVTPTLLLRKAATIKTDEIINFVIYDKNLRLTIATFWDKLIQLQHLQTLTYPNIKSANEKAVT